MEMILINLVVRELGLSNRTGVAVDRADLIWPTSTVMLGNVWELWLC